MPTAQPALSVFNRTANQNAETFAKMLAADRTRNVYQSIMLPSVNAYPDMVAKRPMQLLAADHCQFHAHCHLIARPIHTVIMVFASRLVS